MASEDTSAHTGDIDTKGLKQERIPVTMSGQGHEVSFDVGGLPDDIYVGDTVALVLFAQCSSGCDLKGDAVRVTGPDGSQLADATLSQQEGDLACTDGMLLTMPHEPGDYQYRVSYTPAPLPSPDDGGPAFPNPHPARELLLVLTVKEHHVTLSTWGLTSPVYVGEEVSVTVGASCSDGCALTGCRVQVCDAQGDVVSEGELERPQEPRPSLWWASLSAIAPTEAKLHRWEARFVPARDMEVPHEASAHKFSFVARVRPERTFKITVIDDKTGKPQRSARVELKPSDGGKASFATTGADGTGSIGCAKGTFDLKVTSPSRKNFTETVDLTAGDVEVEVHLQPTSSTEEKVPMRVVSAPAAEDAEDAPAAPAAPAEKAAESSAAAEASQSDK